MNIYKPTHQESFLWNWKPGTSGAELQGKMVSILDLPLRGNTTETRALWQSWCLKAPVFVKLQGIYLRGITQKHWPSSQVLGSTGYRVMYFAPATKKQIGAKRVLAELFDLMELELGWTSGLGARLWKSLSKDLELWKHLLGIEAGVSASRQKTSPYGLSKQVYVEAGLDAKWTFLSNGRDPFDFNLLVQISGTQAKGFGIKGFSLSLKLDQLPFVIY